MITGVIGLTLWTDDLDKMFHFYNDTMRLPLHARHDDFIAFEFGGVASSASILAYMVRSEGYLVTLTG